MHVTRYQVKDPHKGTEGEPLIVHRGDRLRFEHRKTEWPGWIWCTADSDKTAWVPESWTVMEDDTCVMHRDYSARELSVAVGESFTGALIESGWIWGTDEHGRIGWVPLRCLEPIED